MALEIVGILLSTVIFLVLYGASWTSALANVWDFPTVFCILVLTVPILFQKRMAKDFLRAFKLLNEKYECKFSELRHALNVVEMMQKQVLCAGFIVTIQGLILVFHKLSDITTIGPNLNVAMLAAAYTAFLELLLLPLQIMAKRRIVDYMENEQDTEETETDKGLGIEDAGKEQDAGKV